MEWRVEFIAGSALAEGVDNFTDAGAQEAGGMGILLDYNARTATIGQRMIFNLGANGSGTVITDLRDTDSFTNIEAVAGSVRLLPANEHI